MFGTIVASMPKPAKTSTRKRDGTTLRSTRAARRGRSADRAQVVRRFAAAVVQHDRPAEQPRDEDGRQRREQERGVRRREDVHDVGARQLAEQQRPVDQLGDDRAQVLDVERLCAATGRQRIDRHQPGLRRPDRRATRGAAGRPEPPGRRGSARTGRRWRHESPSERHVSDRPRQSLPSAKPGPGPVSPMKCWTAGRRRTLRYQTSQPLANRVIEVAVVHEIREAVDVRRAVSSRRSAVPERPAETGNRPAESRASASAA